MRVLLTRPEAASREVAAALAARGMVPLVWPLTQIVPVGGTVEVPAGTTALAFTSAHGVAAFADACPRRDLPALCVGRGTAERARSAGFSDVISAQGDQTDLATLIAASPHRHLFHPRGRDVAGDLAAMLAPHGVTLRAQVVYAAEEGDAPPPKVLEALEAGGIDAVTVWSARNGAILARRLAAAPGWPVADTALLAISDRAARPLADTGFREIRIAAQPDREGMLAELDRLAALTRR